MRQVPKYAIIGNGKVANHFCYYFRALSFPFYQWSRSLSKPGSLTQIIQNCDRVLILIKDSAIEGFIQENPILHGKILIHFSGRLFSSLAYGAHPLFTFSHELYDLATYQKIPFILEKEGPSFSELLPGLPNPHYQIPRDLKNLYHSLCVLSGNFSCILWQKFFHELEHTFHLPKSVTHPYMQQIFSNLQKSQGNILTGPLARNDYTTIAANLAALSNDPFQKIYQAFVEVYQEREKNELA